MKNKGYKLAIAGLVIGILIGLGIRGLKRYAVSEVTERLQHEISASAPECKLAYDSMNISLMTLTATATNVRMVCNGRYRLRFEKIHGLFSISRIFEKRI